ncbi:MAG: Fe-S cluster assembly protein SufD, partial [Parvularculaceae bacterium]|nr:Fe-S cluster assembly protein SufD [Parvularculaceae bacterium]
PSVAPSLLPTFAGPAPFDLDAYVVEIANGVVEEAAFEPQGVKIGIGLNDRPLGAALSAHPMALLAAATARRRADILVGGAAEQPVWIRHMAGAGASSSRVRVALEPGASLVLIESYEGRADSFAADVLEIELGEGATLSRYILQDADESAVLSAVACVAMAKSARFEQTALAFGARLARIETRIETIGDSANVSLDSASLVSGGRHVDVTTHVAHGAEGGLTRQRHKSALRDRARSIFQGKFLVARTAQKTDARMAAKALLLAEGAEVDHKPELEIYADDVQCAHGATAGALDPDALFYLRQRGLPEGAARALLVEAFLGEIFDETAHPGVAATFRARTARWLESA